MSGREALVDELRLRGEHIARGGNGVVADGLLMQRAADLIVRGRAGDREASVKDGPTVAVPPPSVFGPVPDTPDCACCGFMARPRFPDPWEGRLDGYCTDCAHTRCDADPGACGKNEVRS